MLLTSSLGTDIVSGGGMGIAGSALQLNEMISSCTDPSTAPSKSDRVHQQEESDALVATVNAFLTVGSFALLGQAHDALNSEFIVATPAGISHLWICHSTTLTEPCAPILLPKLNSGPMLPPIISSFHSRVRLVRSLILSAPFHKFTNVFCTMATGIPACRELTRWMIQMALRPSTGKNACTYLRPPIR
jgi:hypothetical protein